jgi:cytochrome c
MRQVKLQRVVLAGMCLAFFGFPVAARADAQLALEKGCYSCHGANPRGEAPPWQRLSARLARLKGDEAAEKAFVEKFGNGKVMERVEAHERISAQSAAVLVRWVVEGAK